VPTSTTRRGQVLIKSPQTAKNNNRPQRPREGPLPTKDKTEPTSSQMGGAPTLIFPRIQGADVARRSLVLASVWTAHASADARAAGIFNLYADGRRDIQSDP